MDLIVLFDLDGVIINSHEVQKKALEVAYRKYCGEGEVPYEAFFRLSGDSLENIFATMGLPQEMTERYRQYSREHIEDIVFHERFLDIFDYLNQMEVKCVLCTGKERKRTLTTLQYFNIDHYFSKVICSDDVKRPKPDPESIEVVKNLLQADIEQLLFVGDGINDIRCARNADVKSVAVTWGDLPRDLLEPEKPDVLVNCIDELFYYLRVWISENR